MSEEAKRKCKIMPLERNDLYHAYMMENMVLAVALRNEILAVTTERSLKSSALHAMAA